MPPNPPLLPAETERMRRWRLVLGPDAQLEIGLSATDQGMDNSLSALYSNAVQEEPPDGPRRAGLERSSPNVARWLGDIRTYFPMSAVTVMQQDALSRFGLRQMLLEPELLAATTRDVQLVATLLALRAVIPSQTRDTARQVVRAVVDNVERRLKTSLIQAVHGSLNRATRRQRPRAHEIDWDRTIRANLKHYQVDRRTIIPERLIGHGRKQTSLRDVILCIDQSGSMATSAVYAGIFGCVLASIRALSTRVVVFDTAVVDLTEDLQDPVDLLFGVHLGGGTDINRALAYCQGLIRRPAQTIFVLLSDLYEGGNALDMRRRVAWMVNSGVQCICLLALSDRGVPAYHRQEAASMAASGVPTFGCTPELFPDMLATALQGQDLSKWASRQDIVTVQADQTQR